MEESSCNDNIDKALQIVSIYKLSSEDYTLKILERYLIILIPYMKYYKNIVKI